MGGGHKKEARGQKSFQSLFSPFTTPVAINNATAFIDFIRVHVLASMAYIDEGFSIRSLLHA
jgi:hypothetical protein